MRKNVTERVFRCPYCGTVVTAYKKSSRRIVQGHTKHMYDYAENYEYFARGDWENEDEAREYYDNCYFDWQAKMT